MRNLLSSPSATLYSKNLRTFALGATILATAPSCTAPVPEAPPPSPQQQVPTAADPEAVRQRMQDLSKAIRDLNDVARGLDTPSGKPEKSQVLAKLDVIIDIAKSLRDSELTASHPKIAEGMPRFLDELDYTRLMIDDEKPQYTYAIRIVGTCTSCHELKPCPADPRERCLDLKTPPGSSTPHE